ncbi:MAG: DNA gyrase/topoisomerase IV subunit A [Flavobacteriales bacterium]|nr:DNA gyrase/topoisomerase IV subunit A [Flavobacteriales bacterium]
MSEENGSEENEEKKEKGTGEVESAVAVSGMYQDWFLDYASYVILERAVPNIEDGLKPVQTRIMHSMFELEDGRYNKVANIIGHCMKYHPHGDMAIGDAIVGLGQKELLIDTQGNWGNTLTGDRAAAGRYIEARLSKFALEVVFNPKTTNWKTSYDGRNKEPVTLPVKFPLLLAQGVEGIAVGLSTKILPHNFNELIDASIQILKGKKATVLPDFLTGGMIDASSYNDGQRGGKVRVRAKISKVDTKTLVITEIPYGTNTSNLIDSILKANDKGKIKIKKVEDNTAQDVEILIHLAPGISPDKTIDALYSFTDCESSISPNACVIVNDKPMFMSVSEILQICTQQTLDLLKRELEIKLGELQEQWHFASLEKIFIENRIYRDIEEEETWEGVISAIDKGLKPHIKHLIREVTVDDITRLTEIRIKRISKFDSNKADDNIAALEGKIAEVKHDLEHLVDFAVAYYKNLKDKYGKGRERKTEIRHFDVIQAARVAVANEKLYINREEGFIGTGLKKDEFVSDCSDIDDIIVFMANGNMKVVKVDSKVFVGKEIIHAAVFRKNDKRTIYNMIYRDGPRGSYFSKRFPVTSITRDKDYDLTAGTAGSTVEWFTANPNGEAEVVLVHVRPKPKLKKLKFDFDFAELAIKGRAAKGNTFSKNPLRKIEFKEKGLSTLGARKIWFDDTVQRLNADGRGELLGEFAPEDKILTIMQNGEYKLLGFDISTQFEDDMTLIEKWNPEKPLSVVYLDTSKKIYMIKRFLVEKSSKAVSMLPEGEENQLELVTTDWKPRIQINFRKKPGEEEAAVEEINVEEFIAVKGLKAKGNQLTKETVNTIDLLDPIPYEPPVAEPSKDDSDDDNGESSESDEVAESEESTTVGWDVSDSKSEDEDEEEPKSQPKKPNESKGPSSNSSEGQLGLF